MVELVGMCLGYVDPLTQPVCRAVCRRWHHALQAHARTTQTATTAAVTATPRRPPRPEEKGLPAGPSFAALVAQEGRLAVLQWARASGAPWEDPGEACAGAARGGHLAVLQWLHAEGCAWDQRTTAAAAHGGHLAVLQWALANGCPMSPDS